jgi:hypothetical protein
MDDPSPCHQFIVDLQSWIESRTDAGYQIILGIDANEPFHGTGGNFTPLQFTMDKPIPTKGHDGTLEPLVQTCGLIDPLQIQHSNRPPPATYNRGQDRNDFIFVSAALLPCVNHTGIFPYNSVFMSDHCPCYVDFETVKLFGETTPNIDPPQYRGLS